MRIISKLVYIKRLYVYFNIYYCKLVSHPLQLLQISYMNKDDTIEVDNKKCYNCGKTFKTAQHLQNHKKRKTPCLIRQVDPENLLNPNRCIYCNRIYKQKSQLTVHLKKCTIKNGGMNILDEKIQYEQQFRILGDKIAELEKTLAETRNQLNVPVVKQHIVNNGTINNITVNFHNYDNPKTDTLRITQDDLLVENVTKKLIELLYFNENIPENHVLYRPNIKERRLLVHKDGGWRNVAGVNLDPLMLTIKNTISRIGHDKINCELYKNDDGEFYKLYPVVQNAIKSFNRGEQQITDGTIMEIITENREVVKHTIPAM